MAQLIYKYYKNKENKKYILSLKLEGMIGDISKPFHPVYYTSEEIPVCVNDWCSLIHSNEVEFEYETLPEAVIRISKIILLLKGLKEAHEVWSLQKKLPRLQKFKICNI